MWSEIAVAVPAAGGVLLGLFAFLKFRIGADLIKIAYENGGDQGPEHAVAMAEAIRVMKASENGAPVRLVPYLARLRRRFKQVGISSAESSAEPPAQ